MLVLWCQARTLRFVRKAVQIHKHILGFHFLVLEGFRYIVLQLSQYLDLKPVLVGKLNEVLQQEISLEAG
jgi:hypothetical protein